MRNVTQVSEKIKTHFLFHKFSSRKSCRIRDNVEECCTAGQATDDNIIQRMSFACWITKATDTTPLRVMFISFSTAKDVTRTHLNMTLYAYWLYFYFFLFSFISRSGLYFSIFRHPFRSQVGPLEFSNRRNRYMEYFYVMQNCRLQFNKHRCKQRGICGRSRILVRPHRNNVCNIGT